MKSMQIYYCSFAFFTMTMLEIHFGKVSLHEANIKQFVNILDYRLLLLQYEVLLLLFE